MKWRICPSHAAALLAASKALHVSELAFLAGSIHRPREIDVQYLLTEEIQQFQEKNYAFMSLTRGVRIH